MLCSSGAPTLPPSRIMFSLPSKSIPSAATLLLGTLCLTSTVSAQFDPNNGRWKKRDPGNVRVMTWNIQDNIRTGESKLEGNLSWHAVVTIVASLRPDILLLQETADNGFVDSVPDMLTVFDLFFHGGADPFVGGNVESYVTKYAPGYVLPHVFVSFQTDGFNRNVILSRFPFKDLNGDGISQYNNLFFMQADAYAPGTVGNPIIRGLQMAELDLPDSRYLGDLVVMNCHLRAGGQSSDLSERLAAGKNIAYMIDYWYCGAGSGIPDPSNVIFESPAATSVLDSLTPVILGGDLNEDESTNFRKGPAEWIANAEFDHPVLDGPDRDRGDSTYDLAVNQCNPVDDATQGNNSTLDYIIWQDSIAVRDLEFIFHSGWIPSGCNTAYPPELMHFPFPNNASIRASDHRPVIVDLRLPMKPTEATDPTPSPRPPRGGVFPGQ